MDQTTWHRLSECTSAAVPALSSHADGKLYIAAVRTNGQVAFTSIRRAAEGWAAWEIVAAGAPPQLPAAHSTPPVLLRRRDRLYLFCRGVDDNLYVTSRHMHADWLAWRKLTADNSVDGPIGVAFTEDPLVAHVVHAGPSHTVICRRFHSNWSPGTTSQWTGIREAEIASDGTGEVFVALRSIGDRLSFVRQTFPWSAAWHRVANEHGVEFDAPCLALSNVVAFADSFHVLYATKAVLDDMGRSFAYTLAHARVQGQRYADGWFRTVREYRPTEGRHPQPTIAVYRDKLVAAFADEHTDIRSAWLDTADAEAPWIGGQVVAAGKSGRRPSLAPLNFWPYLGSADRANRNFGNDLFAVASGVTADSIWFANFSRAFFVEHLASIGHRVDWCINYSGTIADCPKTGNLPAATEVPEFSEIGYGSMTIPFRTMRTVFPRVMQNEGTPGADYMAWIHTVVLATLNKGAYFGPHMNVDYDMPYGSWQHEMLHRLATSMGLWDDDNPAHHPNPNLMVDFFPDHIVQAATALFREQTNTNKTCSLGDDGDRCRGFVRADSAGTSGEKYDVGSCQHSLIEFTQLYIRNGPGLRRLVVADLRAGVDLLRRKYDWVRQFIFGGVEFGIDGLPVYPVHILNRNSDKALDVASWSLDDNGAVQQYGLHRKDNQRWLLVPKGHGYWQIIAMHSGLALDVTAVSHADGAGVQQYSAHNGHNQQWQLVPDKAGSYEIVARHSGKCLEVVGWAMHDRAAVAQYARHGGNNQKWRLDAAAVAL